MGRQIDLFHTEDQIREMRNLDRKIRLRSHKHNREENKKKLQKLRDKIK